MPIAEQEIYSSLKTRGLTLGVVESATGGLISHRLTDVPGISECYKGSVTAYANETKMNLVGVKPGTLSRFGAVSAPVAKQMAAGGRRALNVGVCIADTGIAGPGGATPDKPVGMFYFGLACGNDAFSRRRIFSGSREEIKVRAADVALEWVRDYLKKLPRVSDLPEKHVVTCFLECRGRILLLKRSLKVGSFQGRWAGVSGYLDLPADEQSLVEISEETGLSSREVRLVRKGKALALDDPDMQVRWIIHPYLYHTECRGKVKTNWESCDLSWVKPDEISNFNTVPMLSEALLSVYQ